MLTRPVELTISREHLTELVQHLEQAFLITSLAAGEAQIAQARVEGLMAVSSDGLGLVTT